MHRFALPLPRSIASGERTPLPTSNPMVVFVHYSPPQKKKCRTNVRMLPTRLHKDRDKELHHCCLHIKPCGCRRTFPQEGIRVPAGRDCQVVPGKHRQIPDDTGISPHGYWDASIRRGHGTGTLRSLKTTR